MRHKGVRSIQNQGYCGICSGRNRWSRRSGTFARRGFLHFKWKPNVILCEGLCDPRKYVNRTGGKRAILKCNPTSIGHEAHCSCPDVSVVEVACHFIDRGLIRILLMWPPPCIFTPNLCAASCWLSPSFISSRILVANLNRST